MSLQYLHHQILLTLDENQTIVGTVAVNPEGDDIPVLAL